MMKLRIRKGHRLIMLMALKASDIHTPLMLLRLLWAVRRDYTVQWFSGKSREHHGAGLNKMVNAALASVESFGLLFGIHFSL